MAFDAFSDESGGFGGSGNGRFALRLCRAVDYHGFYAQNRDDSNSEARHWIAFYPLISYEFVDAFDPRNHPLPKDCANVLIFDTMLPSNGPVALYTYGEIITWESSAAILGQIGFKAGMVPPFALPPRGDYVRSDTEALTPILKGTTTGVFEQATKARPICWLTDKIEAIHPRLRPNLR